MQQPLLCAFQEEEVGGDGEEAPAAAPVEEAPLMSDADMTQLMRVCPMAFRFVTSLLAQPLVAESVGSMISVMITLLLTYKLVGVLIDG